MEIRWIVVLWLVQAVASAVPRKTKPLDHNRRSINEKSAEKSEDGPTPPPLPLPTTEASLADTLSPPLLSSIQFEGEALSQVFSAIKAFKEEDNHEKEGAMPPSISPHDMLSKFFVAEQKEAAEKLLNSVTTTVAPIPTEATELEPVEVGVFQEVKEVDEDTETQKTVGKENEEVVKATTERFSEPIVSPRNRTQNRNKSRRNQNRRTRRPKGSRRRSTTTTPSPQLQQEIDDVEVVHKVHKINSKAQVPTQEEVIRFFGRQRKSRKELNRNVREDSTPILQSMDRNFEEIQTGDFESYLEFFTVTYSDIKVMYYAITSFGQNLTNGPHIAYIIDDDNANFWLKNTWYLSDRETEKARLFQCTERFLYYFEENGMVRLQTPAGFECAHSYLYGNIMFMNKTHFIQLGMSDGYIGKGLRNNAIREKSKLRDDLQLTVDLCFKQDRFCAQANPTNLVTISDEPFGYFSSNLELHMRRSRNPMGQIDIKFYVQVHGNSKVQDHKAFFFPSDLKTFGGELDKHFERVAVVPLIKETDQFFAKYDVNFMTDAEIAMESERRAL